MGLWNRVVLFSILVSSLIRPRFVFSPGVKTFPGNFIINVADKSFVGDVCFCSIVGCSGGVAVATIPPPVDGIYTLISITDGRTLSFLFAPQIFHCSARYDLLNSLYKSGPSSTGPASCGTRRSSNDAVILCETPPFLNYLLDCCHVVEHREGACDTHCLPTY